MRYVDETGTITLEREGEMIVLGPGEIWFSTGEIEVWERKKLP